MLEYKTGRKGRKRNPAFGTGVRASASGLRGEKVTHARAEAGVTVSWGFSSDC